MDFKDFKYKPIVILKQQSMKFIFVQSSCERRFSSASFFEKQVDEFGILINFSEVF